MCVRRAKSFIWWVLIKSSLLFIGCTSKSVPPTTLYMASSLMPLKNELEKNYPSLNLIFESSAVIARQIKEGAPCDAVIVADERWRNYLNAHNAVEDGHEIFAYNSLVVYSNQAQSIKEASEFFLKSPQALIIADPEVVPLGFYTKQALRTWLDYEKVKKDLIFAHSAQHAQMLLLKRVAPFAILYKTNNLLELYPLFELDKKLHDPIYYSFLRCHSGDKTRTDALYKLIFSNAFKDVLVKKGFGLEP